MNFPIRTLALGLIVLACSSFLYEGAQAGGDHFIPPVSDALTKTECGSCHMAYSPSMLPAKSWKQMMGDLKHHFGSDASLDRASNERIAKYLMDNAADTAGRRFGDKWMRGLASDITPQRITELPKWLREHRKVPERDWTSKEVRSKANCVACHADAERGYFED